MSLSAAYIFGFKVLNNVLNFFNAPMIGNGDDIEIPLTAFNAGAVSFASGIDAEFNGADNSYLQYDDNDIFNFSDGTNDVAFEINFKIKPSNIISQALFLNKHGSSGSNRTWEVRHLNQKLRVILYSNLVTSDNISYENSTTLLNGTEYQIKVTYDGNGNLLVFVDGDSTGTFTGNVNYVKMGISNNKVTVGRLLTSSSFNFAGTIRGLTIEKITSDPTIEPADIISAYKFENNFIDSKGTNNGTGTGVTFNNSIKIAGSESSEFAWTTTPDYVTIPYSTDFDFSAVTNSKPFSISTWVYITDDKDSFFINKRDVSTEAELQLNYISGVFQFTVFDGQRRIDTGSFSFIQSTLTPLTSVVGRWINLVGVFDGVTDCILYVDNVAGSAAVNTNAFAKIKNFNQSIKLGAAGFSLSVATAFKGYMDEVYIINKELTTGQITYAYNKGIAGESLIGEPIEQSDFISYWKFDGNANDSVGTNNGTPTNITYPAGLIGNAADFNGTTSKIAVPDADNLSFGNGTSDVDFSTIILVKFDDLANNPRLMAKVLGDNTNIEYLTIAALSKYRAILFDESTSGTKDTENDSVLSISTWFVLTTTYNASSGVLKVYADNNLINTDLSSGTYVAMENGNAPLAVGYDPRNVSNQNTLDGQINALSFLNVELTPEQVAYAVAKYKTYNQHLI